MEPFNFKIDQGKVDYAEQSKKIATAINAGSFTIEELQKGLSAFGKRISTIGKINDQKLQQFYNFNKKK